MCRSQRLNIPTRTVDEFFEREFPHLADAVQQVTIVLDMRVRTERLEKQCPSKRRFFELSLKMILPTILVMVLLMWLLKTLCGLGI
jgi:hypothetical protein